LLDSPKHFSASHNSSQENLLRHQATDFGVAMDDKQMPTRLPVCEVFMANNPFSADFMSSTNGHFQPSMYPAMTNPAEDDRLQLPLASIESQAPPPTFFPDICSDNANPMVYVGPSMLGPR